jgi:hypothetical protein
LLNTPSFQRLIGNYRLEGQANDLPTPFTPEEFKSLISEKKTNPPQVPADSYSSEFLQLHHLDA